MSGVEVVGHVWVVIEMHHGHQTIYGVFETEEDARKDYGRVAEPYTVQFIELSLWGRR